MIIGLSPLLGKTCILALPDAYSRFANASLHEANSNNLELQASFP